MESLYSMLVMHMFKATIEDSCYDGKKTSDHVIVEVRAMEML
jgi:hypothetical protein